jgi:Kef-type K+ transport system membrane component KefB
VGEAHVAVLLVGLAVAMAAVIQGIAARLALPALVGWLALGLLLRGAEARWGFMTPDMEAALELLASLGIVALLFEVGLTSNPGALARKLPAASVLWAGNMVAAFGAGFAAVFWVLDLGLLPALFAGTALTATSVGVAVAIWEENGALDSPDGRLTLDVAELDDIGGVALMALLFAVAPVLRAGGSPWEPLAGTLAWFAVTFLGFAAFCWGFAHTLEGRITRRLMRLPGAPERMVAVAGIGFVIAAVAGWLGFSLAIGALFAGLVFSRDPNAVRTEPAFRDLYAFLTPFFFINIGFHVDPGALGGAAPAAAVLLLAAVAGKLAGVGLPALWQAGAGGALLVSVSMLPRAEIAMVVMDQGRRLGPGVVPDRLYSAMVLVSALTCLLTPLALRPLLARRPEGRGAQE